MPAGNPAEVVSVLDTIYDAFAIRSVDDLLERAEEGSETKHVANDDVNALFVSRIRYLLALLGRRRSRFLEQKVVSELNSLHRWLKMHLILSTDHYDICKLRL